MKSILYILLLLLLSCENLTDAAFKREVSVACVLSNYYERQEIYIYYTSEGAKNISNRDSLFVKDAGVEVSSLSQNIPFYLNKNYNDEHPGWVYKDSGQKLKVSGGTTYTLNIKTDAGTVSGATTVPDSFTIVFPRPGEYYEPESILTAEWERKPGAAIYFVEHLTPPDTVFSYRTGKYEVRRFLSNFSTTGNAFALGENSVLKKGNHILRVMACDINLKRHLFDDIDISGLKGGYGYFGSAFVDTVSFFIK